MPALLRRAAVWIQMRCSAFFRIPSDVGAQRYPAIRAARGRLPH